jgi:Uma2 family endonuclease
MPVVFRDADIEVPIQFPRFSQREFERLCTENRHLKMERMPDGEVKILPGDTASDNVSASVITFLGIWNLQRAIEGKIFGSSAGFLLPDGSTRSPDAAWMSKESWEAHKTERPFPHICPELIVEVRSSSDTLAGLQTKMQEWVMQGAKLAWLVDPTRRKVHIYRPDQPVQTLSDPAELSGEPEFPGLHIPMDRVFPDA